MPYVEKYAAESKSKREKIKRDLQELENKIRPLYLKIALDLQSEKTNREKHYEGIDKAITRYEDKWLKLVNDIARKKIIKIQRYFFYRTPGI